MVEIELKFEIGKKQIPEIVSKLRDLGFKDLGRFYEKTVMYDNPSLIMMKTNGRIRLRTIKKRDVLEFEFSYKKPLKSKSGAKKEIEYEIETKQGIELESILEVMGYFPTTSYERFRNTFKIRNVKVTVDEFPFAVFIEVEGDRTKIYGFAKKLGFKPIQNLKEPCDTLFTKWREKRGLPFKADMSFGDFNK